MLSFSDITLIMLSTYYTATYDDYTQAPQPKFEASVYK